MNKDIRKYLTELDTLQTHGIENLISMAVESVDKFFGKEVTYYDLVNFYDETYVDNQYNYTYSAAIGAISEAIGSEFIADLRREGYDYNKYLRMVLEAIMEREGKDISSLGDTYRQGSQAEIERNRFFDESSKKTNVQISEAFTKEMNLIKEACLMEAYEDRVFNTAVAIRQAHSDINKGNIGRLIQAHGSSNPEVSVGGKAFNDLVKDVWLELVSQGATNRQSSSRGPLGPRKLKTDEAYLRNLGMWMQRTVSEMFPDGDPTDVIYPTVEKSILKKGSNESVEEVISAACKLVLGCPDLYTYLADMWDDVKGGLDYDASQGHEVMDIGDRNPWRQ